MNHRNSNITDDIQTLSITQSKTLHLSEKIDDGKKNAISQEAGYHHSRKKELSRSISDKSILSSYLSLDSKDVRTAEKSKQIRKEVKDNKVELPLVERKKSFNTKRNSESFLTMSKHNYEDKIFSLNNEVERCKLVRGFSLPSIPKEFKQNNVKGKLEVKKKKTSWPKHPIRNEQAEEFKNELIGISNVHMSKEELMSCFFDGYSLEAISKMSEHTIKEKISANPLIIRRQSKVSPGKIGIWTPYRKL